MTVDGTTLILIAITIVVILAAIHFVAWGKGIPMRKDDRIDRGPRKPVKDEGNPLI